MQKAALGYGRHFVSRYPSTVIEMVLGNLSGIKRQKRHFGTSVNLRIIF
jgi:hypothetical protein